MKNKITFKQRIFGEAYTNDERIEEGTNKIGMISFLFILAVHFILFVIGIIIKNEALADINIIIAGASFFLMIILSIKYNAVPKYNHKFWHSIFTGVVTSILFVAISLHLSDGFGNYYLLTALAFGVFALIALLDHLITTFIFKFSDKKVDELLDKEQ